MLPRSHLYVPGDQPDKLAKASGMGSDAWIVDLEDGVAPTGKEKARLTVASWLERRSAEPAAHGDLWIRVNPSGADGLPPVGDLEVAVHRIVRGIVVAKCESPSHLRRLDDELYRLEERVGLVGGAIAVAALVETAAALIALDDLARSPRVRRLQVGEADLAASLGMSPGTDGAEWLPIRLQLVVASAAAGLDPPVGPVYTRIDDTDGLRTSTQALRRLGFGGRCAVHPSQVPVINEVFTPTEPEVVAAADLVERLDAAARQGRGVSVAADGSLIDEAVVRRARAVLSAAERSQRRSEDPQEGTT